MADETDCQIKLKVPGEGWHYLLDFEGRLTHHWVRAVVLTREQALRLAGELIEDNPGLPVRVIPVGGGRKPGEHAEILFSSEAA